jgi:hypothetical protein
MSIPEHSVPRALAPWNTKSECYWLFLTLKKLPQGLYDPLEASSERWVGKDTGEFKGGLGCIMIVRYRDTPVGTFRTRSSLASQFRSPVKL